MTDPPGFERDRHPDWRSAYEDVRRKMDDSTGWVIPTIFGVLLLGIMFHAFSGDHPRIASNVDPDATTGQSTRAPTANAAPIQGLRHGR